jgi:hypothetical protein
LACEDLELVLPHFRGTFTNSRIAIRDLADISIQDMRCDRKDSSLHRLNLEQLSLKRHLEDRHRSFWQAANHFQSHPPLCLVPATRNGSGT